MSNLFCIPNKIISGENALKDSGKYIAGMGRKALIISDSMMRKLGNIDKLTDVLTENRVAFSIYSEVDSEPTNKTVEAGVSAYISNDCDFLIAIGGGSPIDTMKAIAILSVLGGSLSDYLGVEVLAELPPIVAIPTTAGTGSEATQFTIISDLDTNVKMLLKGSCILPNLAVIDPVFTLTMPASITAFTGIDALCHCVEAYTSRKAQPLSDLFALSAARRIFKNIYIAYKEPDNLEARIQMALASTEAGISFSNSSVTIIHGMSRPIGALFHVPHGLSNAMLIEKCMRFAMKAAMKRLADIARYCDMADGGTPDGRAAEGFIEELSALCERLAIPTLREFGVDRAEFEKQIPKMTQDAIKSGSPGNTLADVSAEDIQEIYRSLWA